MPFFHCRLYACLTAERSLATGWTRRRFNVAKLGNQFAEYVAYTRVKREHINNGTRVPAVSKAINT